MRIWLVMIAGGLLTFGIRLSFIYLSGRMQMPERVQRSLRFVPPAILSAILVPEVLMHAGKLDVGPGNERFVAALAAIGVAWATRNTLLTVLTGLFVLLVSRVVAGA